MSEIEKAIGTLEERADTIETDAAWDAMEPELVRWRRVVFDRMSTLRDELAAKEEDADEQLGIVARLNPFDGRRKQYAAKIREVEVALETASNQGERLEGLYQRFWADKSRKQLREFVRRAEKIQRGVAAGWTTKAAAVAGALLIDMDADAAIARVGEILVHGIAENAGVLIATLYAGRSVADAESFLSLAKQRENHVLAAGWLVSNRKIDDAAVLVRDLEADDQTIAAALASDRDAESIDTIRFRLQDRSPQLISAALLCRRPLQAILDSLETNLGLEDSVAAHALFSNRDDAHQTDQRVRAAVRGDDDAERLIRAAAVRSTHSAARCVAIVEGIQQQLTGSWESEAMIIAAAILRGDGADDVTRRSLALL